MTRRLPHRSDLMEEGTAIISTVAPPQGPCSMEKSKPMVRGAT